MLNQERVEQPPQQRYEYFISDCRASGSVWGLVIDDDNWIMFKEDDGTEIFALWPSAEIAEMCCLDEHSVLGAKPKAIPMSAFIKECIPFMVAEGAKFGVFFDKKGSGLVVDGDRLSSELMA